MKRKATFKPYSGPAGGWGSVGAVTSALLAEELPLLGSELLLKQNRHDGFMCVSCSWAKPAKPHAFEFCENGAKATAWEATRKAVLPEFFAEHSLTELRTWSDYQLESQGRLTTPMKFDPAQDRYVQLPWAQAFAEIGSALKGFDPKKVVLYASGRASLETSYMYQLFGRMYGTNNFPDSSNMCHESTSVALPDVIGVPVGTILLEDFDHTDCILFFGQNTTTNSPRMLHQLQDCVRRDVPIITFNPLRERGLERFTDPQNPVQMVAGGTRISSRYLQLKTGGDIAAIIGICKSLIEVDDDAQVRGSPRTIDADFIAEHTHGFDELASFCREQKWPRLEEACGLSRAELEQVAATYAQSKAAMIFYGMGITQHAHGVETVKMIANLLLLRGNIGKPGAGIGPVRGHSNVQGQRTVGITEKTKLVPLDKLAEQYGFEPPREDGMATVDVCGKMLKGEIQAFVGLGGNFLRAVPDTSLMEPAWGSLSLSVQIATKLNRGHLFTGDATYLLPCLGRIDIDRQASGPQAVSMEDSTTCIHGSRGQRKPISKNLLSEPRIVAELAKATLPPNLKIDWDSWVGDYALVRDAIEHTYPDIFPDFNKRMFTPGGFARPLPARNRVWKTPNGKANFTVPHSLTNRIAQAPDIYQLMTIRGDGQFNTTVYSEDDRFRGVYGGRNVILMNADDMARDGLAQNDLVTLMTVASDGVKRELCALQVGSYDIPRGCIAGYYPECNVLMPLWHHAESSKVPAAKSIPVRIRREHAIARL